MNYGNFEYRSLQNILLIILGKFSKFCFTKNLFFKQFVFENRDLKTSKPVVRNLGRRR
jgi:hypothetical protein